MAESTPDKTTSTVVAKRPTLRDVAALAGCSTAVVSMVVNKSRSSSGVSQALTERVRRAADELGYRPDFASRSLARRSTQTLGVYVQPSGGSGLGNVYEGEILDGIETACHARDYDLMAINLSGGGTPDSCMHRFTERRIDGLILLHIQHDAGWVKALVERHPHIVAVNYYGDVKRLSTINFDDQAATRLATEHLYQWGHRRIGYVGLGYNPGPGGSLRRTGYEQALMSLNLKTDPAWTFDWDTLTDARAGELEDMAFANAAVDYLLGLGDNRPTALVTYNDHVAAPLVLALADRGIEVGPEISVVGVDNSRTCQFMRPALTTVQQPMRQMGRRAAELVIDAAIAQRDRSLDSPLSRPVHELCPPELIVRQSSAPPKAS